MKLILVLISLVVILGFGSAYSTEYEVIIPFGAYNPELNTPVEVWYNPPTIQISEGDTVIWFNDDREGHTVTSGKGSGRFGWMSDDYGTRDGLFDSGRFLPGESWSHTFEEKGTFRYFCTIHPWMEGVVLVEIPVPDYPHDALGNQIENFPIIKFTGDNLIEVDMTWEPNVIKTDEKVVFVFQTYDPASNSNLDKMSYDLVITQNGNEVFRDEGITQIGGDYRNVVFENPGPIEIRLENIVSWGTSGIESTARAPPSDISQRAVTFSTIVYENPTENTFTDDIVQPKQTFQLYYELAVAIILVPALLLGGVIFFMKMKKSSTPASKSTPI